MYDTNLQVEYVSTDELQEYKNNSKLHPSSQIDQIASSIEEFGFNNPILAWHNDDGEPEIVAGHGRLMAARKLGIAELPVVFLDHMSEEQRRAYIIADNSTNLSSGFDMEILSVELDAIVDIDMEQFGVEIAEASIGDEGADETDVTGGEPSFNYKEQYGVIVMCADEDDQERVYNRLTDEGYTCKVVAV